MATHVELPRRKSRRTRLLCSCGKPLDRFEVPELMPATPAVPGALLRNPLGNPQVGRHHQTGSSHGDLPAPGDSPRLRYQCRRCMATVVLRVDTIQDAYRRVVTEGGRDVVVGIDV